MRVDLHAAALVERDACLLQAEAVGVGRAADRDQHHVGFDCLCRTACGGLDLRHQRLARCIDARDLGAELECKALLFEKALKLLCDFAVHAGQDAIEKFHHRDLRAEAAPHRAKFQADHAGADDQKPARHLVERQRAGRRHDALFVDLEALELRDIGAGGDHDVFRLNSLGLAVGDRHFDLADAENFSGAADDVDLVLLHQELDALDVAVDALLLEIHHRRQIEFGGRDADAHFCERMSGFLEHFGGVQQAFDGMQPTLRQVPPSVGFFSTTATFMPSCAARMAQT